MSTRTILVSTAVLFLLCACAATSSRESSFSARASEISRFRHCTLADFLRDPEIRRSLDSAEMSCVTYNSDLPEPFKGSRLGRDYYFLTPSQGRYAGLQVLLEVRGRYEYGEIAMDGQVAPNSPFRIALRTGRGADRIRILRILAGRSLQA